MASSAQELAALNELENQISTWFQQHNAHYNRQEHVPDRESVTHADIQLIDVGSILEHLPSSTRVLDHLKAKYAYIASVSLEPQTKRILILISQMPPSTP